MRPRCAHSHLWRLRLGCHGISNSCKTAGRMDDSGSQVVLAGMSGGGGTCATRNLPSSLEKCWSALGCAGTAWMICDMSYCQDRLMVAGDEDLRRPRERGARFIPARWSESDAPPLHDASRLRRGDGAFLDRRPAPPRNVTREDLICVVPRGSFSSRFSGGNRSKRECECSEGPTHIPTRYFYGSLRILLSAPPAPDPGDLRARPLPNAGGKRGETGRLRNPRQGQSSPKIKDRRQGSAADIQP